MKLFQIRYAFLEIYSDADKADSGSIKGDKSIEGLEQKETISLVIWEESESSEWIWNGPGIIEIMWLSRIKWTGSEYKYSNKYLSKCYVFMFSLSICNNFQNNDEIHNYCV